MVCWGNEQKVFELWSCWWGCPPWTIERSSLAPSQGGSVRAPAPSSAAGAGLECSGQGAMPSALCAQPCSSGTPITCGRLQGPGLPHQHCQHHSVDGAGTQAGRTDSNPVLTLAAQSCAEPQASSLRRVQPAKTSLRHCIHQRDELPASHSCL